ncbi:hypothetical protein BBJ28_00010390 [Nothophytophthora sp. Chile5]|nr:hypothetical protein BBJ28_00010390 [Nothophytophthora sp. Chile5]
MMLLPVRMLFLSLCLLYGQLSGRQQWPLAGTAVFERFAEFGWQPFVEPAETYEFFSVSGIFRRANVDASLHVVQPGAQHLVQRSALFDVCLKSGLAHLVVAYIRAEEPRAFQPEGAFAGVKNYVLKEPIAVQQWARRRLEAIEHGVNEMVTEHQYSGHDSPRDATAEALEEEIRQLNGLRMVLIALTERLQDGSRQASHRSGGMDVGSDALDETELMRLTTAGIANLLQLLVRTQSVSCACNCMLWLNEHQVVVDNAVYDAFYSKARSLRTTYREQFEEVYGSNLSSVSGLAEPMLLIEHVMKSASVSLENLGGNCPPTQLGQLLQLLQTPSIQDDVVQFYGDEIDREPLEGYFRVQVALLLYFCLDRAYLSELKQHAHSGVRIAHKMRALADSLAAQLNVRDDMKLTLLALWLVENAVVVKTSGDDQVAAIYENAISLLQQSSAMHLHQKYDLEADLILHLLETLVHRGESLVAWKVWNTFGVELEQSPPAATELVIVISLELDLWERALSLLRSQNRPDLLDLVFNWLMKSHRLKELVQGVTLLPREEKLFHTYMMESNVMTDSDILRDDNIKRVDLLVMYYILRNKYEEAWDVHHEHLALIRATTSGDTQVAMVVLNYPSLRIRASLLANMCAEPPPKEYTHRGRSADVSMEGLQRRQTEKPALLGNETMEDTSDRVQSSVSATPGQADGHLSLKARSINNLLGEHAPMDVQVETHRVEVPENRTVQQATIPLAAAATSTAMETPKRFQFVHEPMTDSRLETGKLDMQSVKSPASAELEGMELERIDEEFSTPISRSRGRRKEPASAPVRRNPRRSARHKY